MRLPGSARIMQTRNEEDQADGDHADALENTQRAGIEAVMELRVVGVAKQCRTDGEAAKIEPATGQVE